MPSAPILASEAPWWQLRRPRLVHDRLGVHNATELLKGHCNLTTRAGSTLAVRMNPVQEPTPKPAGPTHRGVRYVLATLLGVATATYAVALVLGHIPHPVDLTTLILLLIVGLTIVLIVYPGVLQSVFQRIKSVEFGHFSLQLDQIRRTQDMQRHQVDAIASVLPLLMTESERKLLLDFGHDANRGREANEEVKALIRQLRDKRLLVMRRKGDTVGGIPAGPVDLSDYVKLSEMGENFVRELDRIERERAARESPEGQS